MKLLIGSVSLLLIVSAGAVAGAPPPGDASRGAALSAGDAARIDVVREDALELAKLLNPPEPLIAVAARSFDQAFDKGLGSGAEVEKMEKEHPGLMAELRRVTRDLTLSDLRADMPAIQRRYARFYADNFTAEELAELTAFYRSPTGAKIIQAKFASIDPSELVERFAEDPDAKLTAGDVEAVNKGVMPGVWEGMSADDVRALLAFGMRPVASKLKVAAPLIAQIEAEIANEPDPELDAAIDDAMAKVLERFGIGS